MKFEVIIMTFCIPMLFGLEGIAADELRRLRVADARAENGRVLCCGTDSDLAKININLATGERVLLRVGEFPASSFDELFEGVKALRWSDYIPRDGAFPVTGYSRESKLHSVPDCQKIIKKASADSLGSAYKLATLPETAETYQIRFSIVNDVASLYLDSSGAGLHKRGYRPQSVAAPLRETIAAGLARISRYRGREAFRDPFCGSGTIAIEAAFAAKNRAPGLSRGFAAESWGFIGGGVWEAAREEARSLEYGGQYDILGTDIDPECVAISRENAKRAGVDDVTRFEVRDARDFAESTGGVVVTNPPYGERVMERSDAEQLYREYGKATRGLINWKQFILSSHADFERSFGKAADKKRKLYNGMMKCDLYMYGIK